MMSPLFFINECNYMKIKIIVLLSIALILCMSTASSATVDVDGYPNIYDANTRPEAYAIGAPYQSLTNATANFAANETGTECVQVLRSSRIRQDGTIKYLRFYVDNASAISKFRYTLWRTNGSYHDRYYVSENLTITNGLNNISVNIPNVQEGDFYGYIIVGNDVNSTYRSTLSKSLRSTTWDQSTSTKLHKYVMGWTGPSDKLFVIQAIMNSPGLIEIGDSITSGYKESSSYVDVYTYSNLTRSYPYKLSRLGNWTYQNMGVSGQHTYHMYPRFCTDVISQNPDLAILMAGVNNVNGDESTESILTDIEGMLRIASGNNTPLILVSILPWTAGSTSDLQDIDYLNQQYEVLANEYNVTFVNASQYFGVYRPTGPDGNIWDLNPLYTSDGLHLNEAGNEIFASMIYNTTQRIETIDCIHSENSTALTTTISYTPPSGVTNATLSYDIPSPVVYNGNVSLSTTDESATIYRSGDKIFIETGIIASSTDYTVSIKLTPSAAIQFDYWNPNNISCNGILELTDAIAPIQSSITLSNVTAGIEYRLYSMPDRILFASGVATDENATLVASNLTNGTYWIVEMISPSVEVTYWNPNNISCNGILNIYNTSQFNNVSIELNNVTSGAVYKLYRLDLRQVYGSGSVVDGSAYINVTGLLPGQYRIAETGLEQILFSYWNTSNSTTKGIFQITNSTPVTTLQIIFNEIAGSERYSVINPTNNETMGTAFQSTDGVMIELVGLLDGVYHVTTGSSTTTTFTNPSWVAGIVFVGASFILAAGAFINQRRMKK